MDLSFNIESFSKAGPRASNQDSLYISDYKANELILAIADGVGGKPHGDRASSIVIDTIASQHKKKKRLIVDDLFVLARDALINASVQNKDLSDIATTLTVCSIQHSQAVVGHVGDCRIYHLRNNGIITRTKDQTELQRLLDDKLITPERALRYHRKNVLLSVMSSKVEYNLYNNTFDIEPGDRILLLTDGAWGLLTKIEIRDLSVSSSTSQDLAERLVRLIETKEIKDDYSVIVTEAISDKS